MRFVKNDQPKQEFQVGDIAYLVDEDFRWWESQVHRVELLRNGEIEYSTWDLDFASKDINDWVFKSAQDREFFQILRIEE